MPRVSGAIPNLVNGVSQQAAAVRLATQGELQENCYSTIVEGLRKRPPTNHVARLFDRSVIENQPAYTSHLINRDKSERYHVSIYMNGPTPELKVFDFLGAEKTVNFPHGKSYLDHDSLAEESPFRLMTIADYTFILNRNTDVAMSSTIQPNRAEEAVVNIKSGNYGRTYKIDIDGVTKASYNTPDGSDASHSTQIDVTHIATQLKNGLDASGITSANGWTVKRFKSTVYIRKNSGSFTCDVDDGFNNNAAVVVKGKVQNFSDLPAFCEPGFVVEVVQSSSTEFDNYYVEFETDDPSSNYGVWRECPGPGTKLSFDPGTMPHILVREADGSFTFKEVDWASREAGNETTIPAPSFVGRKIEDLFFYKNRFGVLSDEFVVMSRSGEFFDFWRTTATALLDDDPIDVAASHTKVSLLKSAVPFQDRLILFSPQTQFLLRGAELLTPKTVSIRPTTEFESSILGKPIASGRNIYFPVDRGEFTMIREYFFDDTTELGDATDVTSHVPQYVPGEVFKLASTSHEDVIVTASKKDPSALYVYKYYWSGNDKLQSSWSRWSFPGVDRILDFGFIESSLYVVLMRDDGIYLERMDVQPGIKDPNTDFVTFLDRRTIVSNDGNWGYDVDNDITELPISVDYIVDDLVVVTGADGDPDEEILEGLPVEVTGISNGILSVRGDYRDVPLILGTTFESRYRLSPIFVRTESPGGGVAAVTEGRLQLLHMHLQYSNTGYLRVEVSPQARGTHAYVFNGRNMGDPNNIAGKTVLSDGSFRFPVLSRNDRVTVEIVNDSYLPMAVLSAEWTGNYVRKSQRI